MTYVLRIDPDGTVTETEHRGVADGAHEELGESIDIVTLGHPMLRPFLFVGAIDDWGKVKSLPLNRSAWALYGRSPIYGPMWIGDDERERIDGTIVAVLTGDADWIGPELNAAMDDYLRDDGR